MIVRSSGDGLWAKSRRNKCQDGLSGGLVGGWHGWCLRPRVEGWQSWGLRMQVGRVGGVGRGSGDWQWLQGVLAGEVPLHAPGPLHVIPEGGSDGLGLLVLDPAHPVDYIR